MPSFLKQRHALEKTCSVLLRDAVKRSGWKKASNFIYCADVGFFFQSTLTVYLNTNRSVARFTAKTMTIDPILWDILGIPENNSEPLSLRGNGAFTCSTPDFFQTELESPDSTPESIVESFLVSSNENKAQFLREYGKSNFSSLIGDHPNQEERGVYATTLVTSLISEGLYDRALGTAMKYRKDDIPKDMKVTTDLFYDLAIEWLNSKKLQCH